MDRQDWVSHAAEALIEMADLEHAVIPMEARAKACDVQYLDYPKFDPDILNSARDEQLNLGNLTQTVRATKGARSIPVLHLSNLSGRETDFQKAAARKCALQSRYIGWTIGNKRNPEGQIGPAAESVVRESLLSVLESGYVLVNGGHHVASLLGAPVEGGVLDCAAHLLVVPEGLPIPIVLVIEVKNIRGWIYPNSQELYQLLDKAARLQKAHPEQMIMPLLVCRRLHWTAGLMAKELGFFLVGLGAQYIRPSVPRRLVEEVRLELGYLDLTRSSAADSDLVGRLRVTVPEYAARVANRWATFGSEFGDHFKRLRQDIHDRPDVMSELYNDVRSAPDWSATWPLKATHLGT